jgi:hypothetical protein
MNFAENGVRARVPDDLGVLGTLDMRSGEPR